MDSRIVIGISGRKKNPDSISMTPDQFFHLCRDVAMMADPALGWHYAYMINVLGDDQEEERKDYDKKTVLLCMEYQMQKGPDSEGILKFLFQPDSSGRLTPKPCRQLLNLLEAAADSGFLHKSFGIRRDGAKTTGKDFMELVKKCTDRNALEWRLHYSCE